jgi:hypothetical protein
MADFLLTYRRDASDRHSGRAVGWSFSPSYIPTCPVAMGLFSDAAYSASSRGGKLLVLSSFYSSGRLESAIVQFLLDVDRRDDAVLAAIYSVDQSFQFTEAILCDVLPIVAERGLSGKSAVIRADKDIIDVSRVSFFPDYRDVKVKKFLVSDAARFRDFFQMYSGKGIFSVHRDGRSPSHRINGIARHHAYYVDAEKMFRDEQFILKVCERMTGVLPFDVIVSDSSAASASLRDAVNRASPGLIKNAIAFTIEDWRELRSRKDIVEAVNAKDTRTLILAPIVVTGQSVGDIKRHLREACLDSRDRHHFLIGLVRPDSHDVHRHYTDPSINYMFPSKLTHIEDVILPNFTGTQCPWCNELNRLSCFALDDLGDSSRTLLEERLWRLTDGQFHGLSSADVFFSLPEGKRLPFHGGSLFLDLSKVPGYVQVQSDTGAEIDGLDRAVSLVHLAESSTASEGDLCLAVASATHMWRLRSSPNSVKRLAMDTATISNDDKFNEARLRAAIWRSLTPSERELSVRAKGSSEFSTLTRRVFGVAGDQSHTCLQFEAEIGVGWGQ